MTERLQTTRGRGLRFTGAALGSVLLGLTLTSCFGSTGMSAEDLRAELDTIPVPAEWTMVQQTTTGKPGCFLYNCNGQLNYYTVTRSYSSSQSVDQIKQEVAQFPRWSVPVAGWEGIRLFVSATSGNAYYRVNLNLGNEPGGTESVPVPAGRRLVAISLSDRR